MAICVCACSCQAGFTPKYEGKGDNSCEVCESYIVGEWYRVDDEGNLEFRVFYSNGSFTLKKDGVIQSECTWGCACEGDKHAIQIFESGIAYGKSFYDKNSEILFDSVKNNNYTFVELTVDNWKNYFSENVDEIFDIAYEFEEEFYENEWGETVSDNTYTVKKTATFKNGDIFAPYTNITFEVDSVLGPEIITIDESAKKVLKTEIDTLEPVEEVRGTWTFGYFSDGDEVKRVFDMGTDEREFITESAFWVDFYRFGKKFIV